MLYYYFKNNNNITLITIYMNIIINNHSNTFDTDFNINICINKYKFGF